MYEIASSGCLQKLCTNNSNALICVNVDGSHELSINDNLKSKLQKNPTELLAVFKRLAVLKNTQFQILQKNPLNCRVFQKGHKRQKVI